mgnify:CR=1 FL=1
MQTLHRYYPILDLCSSLRAACSVPGVLCDALQSPDVRDSLRHVADCRTIGCMNACAKLEVFLKCLGDRQFVFVLSCVR